MTNRDRTFFNVAKELAQLSDYPRHKIGCAITLKNRVISTGYNSNKTNPLQRQYNRLRFSDDTPAKLHAETAALLPLLRNKDIDLSKVKVYLHRQHADGSLAPSRPCASCMKLLRDNGVKEIHYTTEAGYAEEIII